VKNSACMNELDGFAGLNITKSHSVLVINVRTGLSLTRTWIEYITPYLLTLLELLTSSCCAHLCVCVLASCIDKVAFNIVPFFFLQDVPISAFSVKFTVARLK
jgi:hypothetical protein